MRRFVYLDLCTRVISDGQDRAEVVQLKRRDAELHVYFLYLSNILPHLIRVQRVVPKHRLATLVHTG